MRGVISVVLILFKSTPQLHSAEKSLSSTTKRWSCNQLKQKRHSRKHYEWITFVEPFISTIQWLTFSASAAVATTWGSNAYGFLRKKRNQKERKKRWMGVNVVYTYTTDGCGGAAKALKGERLWGLSKTLAQQEADFTSKEIHFAYLACTNSNKGTWQSAGNWKWGSGPCCFFFKGSGTFITMLINCFWDRAPPTPPPAHTLRTAWLGLRICVYGHMDQYSP